MYSAAAADPDFFGGLDKGSIGATAPTKIR
jgi:hypothetical protein